MKSQVNLSALLGTNAELVDPNPSLIKLTPSTIILGYGSEIFQLSTITRIGKYRHKSKSFLWVIGAILVGLSGLGSLMNSRFSYNSGSMALFGLMLLAVAAGMIWYYMRPGLFAFGFECASGSSRYIDTTDEKFIDDIIKVVSTYMETKQVFGTQINVNNKTIERSVIVGNVSQGDKYVVK